MMKRITVELIGAARILAGQSEVSLNLGDEATWRDAVAALARAAPGLVNEVITGDKRDLLGDHTFKLGGRTFVRDLNEEVQPPEDGRVTLMDFSDI